MDVHGWVWAATIAVILGLLIFDFFGHVKTPHAPTIKESAIWSSIYVGLGAGFALVILAAWGGGFAGEYIAGFITEKSLSIDNLFVFVLIMASFRVPREFQQKVLLFGIAIALIMRTVFILLGATVIERFSWVFYIFGAFLLWTAWTQIKGSGHDPDEGFHENFFLRLMRKIVPTTDGYHGDRFFTKVDGRVMATPMFVVILAIGSADLLFAVDSIPAIFGLTQETYLVFTANAFALLGLRQLFFLIDGLLDRLVYLSYGLGVILAFIGAKLMIHAMHKNELPFINNGEPLHVLPEPSTAFSLIFILATLIITAVASLTIGKRSGVPLAAKSEAIARAEERAHHSMSDYEKAALAGRTDAAPGGPDVAPSRPDADDDSESETHR